jgi:hypothetical protein
VGFLWSTLNPVFSGLAFHNHPTSPPYHQRCVSFEIQTGLFSEATECETENRRRNHVTAQQLLSINLVAVEAISLCMLRCVDCYFFLHKERIFQGSFYLLELDYEK